MIEVVNKRTFRGEGIYIGRPSPLGNPFILGRDGNRDEVIEKYRPYLKNQMKSNFTVKQELTKIKELSREGTVCLICWCSPERCHGDIIKEIIEEEEL